LQHHYPTPTDPKGFQPVLDRRKEKWLIRTVGNQSFPGPDILGPNEWNHDDWQSAVKAADKANEKVGVKIAKKITPSPSGSLRIDPKTREVLGDLNEDTADLFSVKPEQRWLFSGAVSDDVLEQARLALRARFPLSEYAAAEE
jgi:hypothetical protein